MNPTVVNAIIGILVGILVILTTMLGFLIKVTVAWVTIKKDVESIKTTIRDEAVRQGEHHTENKQRLDRMEERLYALRS
jgi:hypothetical protein